MSTVLLQEVYSEVRRLYIAGSELASDDFRLKKLLPRVQQLGERAPVFKRIGEGIAALITPDVSYPSAEAEASTLSARRLQELALLLTSVLRTQGSTATEGKLVRVETRSLDTSSAYSYRQIAAVQEALTTTGGGRYEIVTNAYKEGLFQDLRLIPLAIRALEDPYIEIAEFAMNKILPSYGKPIVPHLLQTLDAHGGKLESRKLSVIGSIDKEGSQEVIYEAAASGSNDVRTTAIGFLAGQESYVESLLEWSGDKKKPIREAAYAALAQSDSIAAQERLYEAFSSKDIELVTLALRAHLSEALKEKLALDFKEDLHASFELKTDAKKLDKLSKKIEYLCAVFIDQTSPLLDEIYISVLKDSEHFNAIGWHVLINHALDHTENIDSEDVLDLLFQMEERNMQYLPYAFRSAYRQLSPAQLYERYAGNTELKWKSKVIREAKVRRQKLVQTLSSYIIQQTSEYYSLPFEDYDYPHLLNVWELLPQEEVQLRWDPRWLDWVIEQDELELAAGFARADHPESQAFLRDKLKKNPEFRNSWSYLLLKALERTGILAKEKNDLLLTILGDKRNKDCYILQPYWFNQLLQLPPEAAEQVEEAQSRHYHEAKKQLAYITETLKGMRA
ncbi:HEAT repeat domain-containing protein [Paenibacillus maysiensis]|uniref:HEAT repeat domain-containing protein n=1 Tax=Paenibacillus maysiensis TaxID=1155954 RepID=UPI00046FD471|nr:hypothetical protein [Paenibacillus maysiensis]